MNKNKNLKRILLALVIMIIMVSLIILIYAISSSKGSSIDFKNNGSKSFMGSDKRQFDVESSQDFIYNLGEYQVNISRDKYLILNFSVRCNDAMFDTIMKKNILVQNAVLETFAADGAHAYAATSNGKEKIKKQLIKNLNRVLGNDAIQEIYFKRYIVQ